ncbi:hypothetical protein BBP40_000659 [Aspergillus hancockii]|nr:hypothetical protein BBP40_000659 [Aspergillus hancockii]
MARSKQEDAEWESHYHELKSLWLDQRQNVDQIRKHMSQKYNFCKSKDQYTRQFKKWNFKKNAKQEEWRYVAHTRRKRKRDGKDPGDVWMHGNLIPKAKVNKEEARHVSLSSQYLGLDDTDPKTPEGVVVCTPAAAVGNVVPQDPANILDMDWSQDLGRAAGGGFTEESDLFPTAGGIALELPIEIPQLSPSAFDALVNEEPVPTSLNHADATSGHGLQLTPATTPTSTDRDEPINRSHDLPLCLSIIEQYDVPAVHGQTGTVNCENNSQSRLRALVKSTTTTMEIFKSNLLASAAARSEVEICQILIDAGADTDAPSESTWRTTALHRALRGGNLECVRMLLDAGADPNLVVDGKTPLHIACNVHNPYDAVKILLDSGAHVNPPQDSARLTPLQWAVNNREVEVVRLLLDTGADPNCFTTSKKGTALQMACRNSDKDEMVELLIAAGADIESRSGYRYDAKEYFESSDEESDICSMDDSWDVAQSSCFCFQSPILIAAENENWEAVQLLLEEGAAGNPSLRKCTVQAFKEELDCQLWHWPAVFTPLQAAIRAQNITMTRMFLSAGAHIDARPRNKYGHTALQIAAMMGNERLIQILLRKGANINAAASVYHGRTALQAASMHLDTAPLSLLLKEGAEVNAPPAEESGRTALQVAVGAGNIEGVRILLDAGAAVNTVPSRTTEMSALQEATQIRDPLVRNEIVHLLLRAGAHTEPPKGQEEHAALHTAVGEGDLEMTEMLLRKGASPNCLLTAGAAVNHRWESTWFANVTALQAAVHSRNIDIVQMLLEWGADVNAPANEKGGQTALQIAVSQNYFEMVELLVQKGADINGLPSPRRGRTALQEAASSGYVQLTQYLLNQGADVNARAAHFGGITALQGAAINGNIRIVMMLLSAGADINGAPAIENGRNAIEGAAENGRLDTLHLLLNCHPDTEEFEIKRKRAAKLALASGHLAIGRFLMAYRKQAWT